MPYIIRVGVPVITFGNHGEDRSGFTSNSSVDHTLKPQPRVASRDRDEVRCIDRGLLSDLAIDGNKADRAYPTLFHA